jgi:hypothetical protein
MNDPIEHRCMSCRRPNPGTENGSLPDEWGVSTDVAGGVLGVICPSCISGELLMLALEGHSSDRHGEMSYLSARAAR